MKYLLAIIVLGTFAYMFVNLLMGYFGQDGKDARAVKKTDGKALTEARLRSNLAERALREIAAGAELPIFVAEDALRDIEKTYTKEIA